MDRRTQHFSVELRRKGVMKKNISKKGRGLLHQEAVRGSTPRDSDPAIPCSVPPGGNEEHWEGENNGEPAAKARIWAKQQINTSIRTIRPFAGGSLTHMGGGKTGSLKGGAAPGWSPRA